MKYTFLSQESADSEYMYFTMLATTLVALLVFQYVYRQCRFVSW